MFASVAGEVAVVAIDHGQAGAHVAGEVEGRDAGTACEGGEGVPKIRRSRAAARERGTAIDRQTTHKPILVNGRVRGKRRHQSVTTPSYAMVAAGGRRRAKTAVTSAST